MDSMHVTMYRRLGSEDGFTLERGAMPSSKDMEINIEIKPREGFIDVDGYSGLEGILSVYREIKKLLGISADND